MILAILTTNLQRMVGIKEKAQEDKTMKKNIFYIALAAFMAIACVEENLNNEINPMEGDEVLFSATSGNRIETRTTYGDEVQGTNGNQIIVNWVNGDKVKVWASAIASRNEAEYAVNTGGNSQNFAESLNKTGSYGIQWGSETSSNFCAIYPSDNLVKLSDGSSAFSENGDKITVKTKIDSVQNSVFVPITAQNQTTAKLDTVGWTGAHFGQDAVTPSMQSALMFARTNGAVPYESDKVTPKPVDLHFKPFTTALKVKFAGYTSNLTNPTVYVQSIVVKAPKGVSIAGNFDIDITGSGISANAAISSISETKGEFANSITINTMLKDGLFLPLKPSQEVTFNVFAIPQNYTMDGTNNLWTVTINTQGHGSFTYKMKPKAGVDGYTLTAGAYHKVKIPNLEVKTEVPWEPDKWITQIPVPVYISELSVPGAWYAGHLSAYQDGATLTQLYTAGIRAFHIDCLMCPDEAEGGRLSGIKEVGERKLICAGTQNASGALSLNYSQGTYVETMLNSISGQIKNNEYVIVVLTVAEKPQTWSIGSLQTLTIGSVNPSEVIPAITNLINTKGESLKVYGYYDSPDGKIQTKGKVLTKDTTIDDVLGTMIIKINTNTDALSSYTFPTSSLVSFGSMASDLDYNTTSDNITDLPYDYFASMKQADMLWGNSASGLKYYYHQAQKTTIDEHNSATENDPIPTIKDRKAAIDAIIENSKQIYDNAAHDVWFQMGIGGYNESNANDKTSVSETLNAYLQKKIEEKMETDPSPVGIVLMNNCLDYTDLIQDIIEMNGKFYLNRQGGSITTGGQGGNGGTTPTPAPAKNAAYAEVGEDAF